MAGLGALKAEGASQKSRLEQKLAARRQKKAEELKQKEAQELKNKERRDAQARQVQFGVFSFVFSVDSSGATIL